MVLRTLLGLTLVPRRVKNVVKENKMAASTTANWWQYSRWLYASGRNLRTMLLDPDNISGNASEVTLQSYVDAIVRFNSYFYDTTTPAEGTITIAANTNLTGDAITVGSLTVAETTDWAIGSDVDETALNIGNAITAASTEVYVSVVDNVITVRAIEGGTGGNSLALTTTDADSSIVPSAATLLGGSALASGSRSWLSDWYYKKNASSQDLDWASWPVSNLLEFEKVIARDVKKIPITAEEVVEADILFAALGNLRLGTGSIFGQVSGNE